MKPRPLWDAWLLIVALAMTAFGVFMAVSNRTALFDGFDRQIDPAFWPSAPPGPEAERFQGWAYGVWGATVAGFGAVAAFVVRGPFRRRRRWARDALVVSVLLWFALDTGVSVAYGVWFNAAFNLGILLALAAPLAITWRDFRPDSGRPTKEGGWSRE